MQPKITECKTCGTYVTDVELLDDQECVTCLREQIVRLRAELEWRTTECHRLRAKLAAK